jgi:hypothetical protein
MLRTLPALLEESPAPSLDASLEFGTEAPSAEIPSFPNRQDPGT